MILTEQVYACSKGNKNGSSKNQIRGRRMRNKKLVVPKKLILAPKAGWFADMLLWVIMFFNF